MSGSQSTSEKPAVPTPSPTATRFNPLRFLAHIANAGVDPALPRHATKHIVLTNQFAIYGTVTCVAALTGPAAHTLLPVVHGWLLFNAIAAMIAITLNARRYPTVASAWLIGACFLTFTEIGRLEPEATEHVGFLIMTAIVAWFVFPPSRRWFRVASTVVAAVAIGYLFWSFDHTPPPPQLPGFDLRSISRGNLVLFFVVVIFFCVRATSEMERVERELVEERKKTEDLLKREVAHQVAERSRELGASLSRAGGPVTPSMLGGQGRFGSRYRVVRQLGEGGMGAVFEVERITDGQRLALKVMTGEVSAQHAARFAREAEIGARIDAPNVVRIVDVGVADGGAPFLVMELVTGGSLEAQRARFGDATWAVGVLRDVARGLVALHAAGVVHRDLKPANILIDEGSTARLSDFGIARFGDALPGPIDPAGPTVVASKASAPAGLTRTGAWMGTPQYMAPESARGGREVGPAGDVFSFGIVAYEILTGRLAYSLPPVMHALAEQPLPEPPPLGDAVDARIAEVLRACLSEDPARRPDAARVLEALG